VITRLKFFLDAWDPKKTINIRKKIIELYEGYFQEEEEKQLDLLNVQTIEEEKK